MQKAVTTVENLDTQAMTELSGASLKKSLHEILKTRFGYNTFREGQLDVIESVLAKRDALAVMPTGGGKSLCYQIPALTKNGLVIVISPLIALMRDQVQALKRMGIPAGAVHSGQEQSEKREVFNLMNSSDNFILYVSPERVQSEGFRVWLRAQRRLNLIAVDEAHCVSQWGPDFRQDYHKLNLLRGLCPLVPILALTATATPPVLADITRQLGLKNPAQHVYGFYRKNLYYQVETCADNGEKMAWLRQSLRQFPEGRVLIYCGTRKQSSELVTELKGEFDSIDYYHAGRTSDRRSKIQTDFGDGTTRILAATNAFGMGIDHPDVRLVVHFQMPANLESLYQEMGRAGRDGKDSTCLLLFSKKDKGLQTYFIEQSEAPRDVVSSKWRALETISQYIEVSECRHAGILTYFRDPQRMTRCGHCDVCDPESARKISTPTSGIEILAPKKKKAKKAVETAPLSDKEQLIYDELKTWRRSYAEEHDIAAFIVFSNKTLEDLVRKKPQSVDELGQVYGFGPNKVEQLGEEVLAKLKIFLKKS